ncbi:MAG TPA: acyl-CoA dehydrogenase family protein [Thermodesulfobacteriota bacterium]|nr:acyl-CoA dehydrogenase family protein [Thermodesulfobacteriota bacterium]
MDFSLPEQVVQLKYEARQWVDTVLNPLSEPLEKEERLPAELVSELKKGRFFGLTIPQEYGGQGWSVVKWFSVLEELAKAYATVRLIAHTMNGLFWRPIDQFGTDAQKKKYLPKIASGELWAANSLTEPESGTGKDIDSKAFRDGDDYLINGHKWLITLFPGYTRLIYTFAASEGGVTAFLVDLPNDGVILKPMPKMMGCVGPRHYQILFKNCRVPSTQVLGERGQGLTVAFDMLHLSRVSIAFCCVGLADKMLELAIAYAKKRSTFGKLIAGRQAIQHMIAQMGTEIQAARLLAYEAAWKFDRGNAIVKEAAMAKLFADQMITRVSEMALRIHGGIGYTQAHSLERHFRDARSFHFEEGTEEIQKLLIARYLLQ